ncbi:unnamed protein product [Rotaria socialis]|uniref:Uncharacterized protein n=1 Tax=Rotaria socialis TaxID=392032 RepID=A0A818GRG5_9BILA|nr:unnamed protein product [Rotaria socialis]CAF3496062.1 unnamed protein product [Rotaria socialis]CAF4099064.1 unnamed protein product [Rotaria socialis]CAF4259578.1 unnamed protein product [Rotaria socialis]
MNLTMGGSMTELILGSIYISQCPIQYLIPIFLIVHGACNVFLCLIGCMAIIVSKHAKKDTAMAFISYILPIQWGSLAFFLTWFIVGNVWILRVKSTVQSPDKTNLDTYCHKTVYDCAFWTIIGHYIIIPIIILIIIILNRKKVFL